MIRARPQRKRVGARDGEKGYFYPVDIMGGLTSVVRGAGIRAAMPWVIMMGRYVVGVGVGMSAVVVPQYVAELASTKRRGQLTAMFEFVLCFGMLASTLMNTVLSPLPGTHLPLSLSPYDRKEHLRLAPSTVYPSPHEAARVNTRQGG